MKATQANLLSLLKTSPQFSIPVYQRTYSWTESQCQQLWNDIIKAGSSDTTKAHFFGSIVYIQSDLFAIVNPPPLLLIDGQQRLTTVSLLVEALARHVGESEIIDGFSAEKLRQYYLLNPLEKGTRRYKLLLTQTDKRTLFSLVDQEGPLFHPSLRVQANFAFFEEKISELPDDIVTVCKGLMKLMVVDVSLDRGHDNPQLIFESMNATGLELSQADLIRNYVLMGLDPDHQAELYRKHWYPMELEFGQAAYGKHFDSFMRYYLTKKTGEIPIISQVYSAFKFYAQTTYSEADGVDMLVADLHQYAGYYCAFALDKEPEQKLANAFTDLRELKVNVAYPLLLELYADFKKNLLCVDSFVKIVRLIESYVFRRAVCGIPTNSLNKTFATFSRSIRKDCYLESVKANFLQLPSYRRFPNDNEFMEEIKTRDLYNFRSRSYWLRKIENYRRKEPVSLHEYTIEHILPQNSDLSTEWKETLGPNWMEVQEKYLHTLGNLTLTGYNAEYSDRPFREKRDMDGGFKHSPLNVNQGLGAVDNWDETSIRARAGSLSKTAICVWNSPKVETETLTTFIRNEQKSRRVYSFDDHPSLAEGTSVRRLFDLIRKEILALDPCVSEEVLKYYVAYKAETNFVDIVPQASRLRLSLNMQFDELRDVQGIAKDITNLGRWGNGDVEIGLEKTDEISYVISLVRQALEKQLGDSAEET